MDDLTELIKNEELTLWIDLDQLTPDEERTILTSRLNIPENMVNLFRASNTRDIVLPFLQEYSDCLFLNFNTIDLIDTESNLRDPIAFNFITSSFKALVYKKILITHHSREINAVSFIRNECLQKPLILNKGTKYLLYLLTDKIIDAYLPCMARLDLLIEVFEKEIYHNQEKKSIERILHFKSDVVQLRRIAYYEKEMFYRLANSESDLVNPDDKSFFHKELEHLNRLTTMLDSYREAVSGILDAHMSLSSQNMNEVMKMLTIMSTIFLPLSVITGFYGMNLNYLPWSNEHYSFIPVTVFMAVVAGIMLFVFKRKKWL